MLFDFMMDVMKKTIASEHREFFNKNGFIEFADLLKPDQCNRLYQDIRQALMNRLKLSTHASLERQLPATLYKNGRDLWRELPGLKKTIFDLSLVEVAWELCQEKPIRIAFDQLLPKNSIHMPLDKDEPYHQFMAVNKPLAEFSSIQGTLCALIICINESTNGKEALPQREPESLGSLILPEKAGNGIYISAELPIDFSKINTYSDYLMIAYARQKSVLISNENDPLGYLHRQWGYNYGDALKDKLNPILLR